MISLYSLGTYISLSFDANAFCGPSNWIISINAQNNVNAMHTNEMLLFIVHMILFVCWKSHRHFVACVYWWIKMNK